MLVSLVYLDYQDRQLFFPRAGKNPGSEKSLIRRLKKAEEYLSNHPGDLKSLADRGVIYYHMGPEHYADSLNSFNSAWRAGAFDRRIFYFSGILYEDLSLFEEAKKQYERFLKHEPGDREVHLRLSRLLFRMEQWDESIESYKALVGKNGKDVTSLTNLGLAHQKRSEIILKKKKISEEEKALVQADVIQAVDYFERASKIEPSLPEEIYLTLAKLYFYKEDWKNAALVCESEFQKDPGQKEILKILSLSYEKMNQKDKALEICTKWLEIEPQNSALKQKIRSLKSQLKIK